MKKKIIHISLFVLLTIFLLNLRNNLYNKYMDYYKGISGKQLKSDKLKAEDTVGEITNGNTIIEELNVKNNKSFSGIGLLFANFGRENKGEITVKIFNLENNQKIYDQNIDISKIEDNKFIEFKLSNIKKDIKKLKLEISSNAESGKAVTIWKTKNEKEFSEKLTINGTKMEGELISYTLEKKPPISKSFFLLFGIIFNLILSGIGTIVILNLKYLIYFGKNINIFLKNLNKYSDLLIEMVLRDIKVKYKKSALGLIWSILNPLLMMIVMTIVFSTLFKSDIENFPIYLLAGQIVFSFFSEATNMAMMSIISNGMLLKKVYIPQYIFPASKVIFALINFLFSLIAVIIVIVITRSAISVHMILFPILVLYIFIFSLGVGLLLASYAVYFRDILHLYGILLLVWTYFTPIFYPVKILPKEALVFIHLNPMYYYIEYFRKILLYHTWPSLHLNFICIMFSFVTLIIGSIIFYKKQNEFVLNV